MDLVEVSDVQSRIPQSSIPYHRHVYDALRPTWATETFSSIHTAYVPYNRLPRGCLWRACGLRIASFTLPTSVGSNALDSIVKDLRAPKNTRLCNLSSRLSMSNHIVGAASFPPIVAATGRGFRGATAGKVAR